MSVCSCQMPALCRPPSLLPSVCVYERKREGESWGISLVPPLHPGWGVACCVLVLRSHCLCNWLVRACVNGPAIVLCYCWNAVEWWLCQPRCPAVLSVFVVFICVRSFFCSHVCDSSHRQPASLLTAVNTLSACGQRVKQRLASGKLKI